MADAGNTGGTRDYTKLTSRSKTFCFRIATIRTIFKLNFSKNTHIDLALKYVMSTNCVIIPWCFSHKENTNFELVLKYVEMSSNCVIIPLCFSQGKHTY